MSDSAPAPTPAERRARNARGMLFMFAAIPAYVNWQAPTLVQLARHCLRGTLASAETACHCMIEWLGGRMLACPQGA